MNVNRGEDFVREIGRLVKRTYRKEVLPSLSGFGALFSLKKYKNPILVSSADGVGTKMILADLLKKYDGVGIDVVAMNVDDVLAMGAEPLFFLDYLACGEINLKDGEEIIRGVAKGCEEAGCSLIGGETAEMPQFYAKGQYELVGFAVGILEKGKIIDGSNVRPGDKILGFPSSGLHSNGFSLVRDVLFRNTVTREEKIRILNKKDKVLGKSWGDALLVPTRIYTKSILPLLKKNMRITGIAHITGGGLMRNIKRLLPDGCQAHISVCRWEIPPVFTRLEKLGDVKKEEMFRVFNMGIGMVLIADAKDAAGIRKSLSESGLNNWIIGEAAKGKKEVMVA